MTPERIVDHIGYYRAGDFLRELFSWLALEWPPAPSEPLKRFYLFSARHRMTIECHRLGAHPAFSDDDLLVLDKVVFGPGTPLPYGLSATSETKSSAREKLSDDTAERDLDVSHFMPDGLVVMVTFKPRQAGISSVTVVRLGTVRAYVRSCD